MATEGTLLKGKGLWEDNYLTQLLVWIQFSAHDGMTVSGGDVVLSVYL